jgi:hypothetical protein
LRNAGLRTGAMLGGSEARDSEGEGKSMRDGRAGFTSDPGQGGRGKTPGASADLVFVERL